MKFELLMKECPKCGSKDKTVQRQMTDSHKAHAKLKAIVCENCGYVFEEGSNTE
ncbi:MAG: TIGR04165 family Cys-rich peptide [Methanobacteriaceae archaeon]